MTLLAPAGGALPTVVPWMAVAEASTFKGVIDAAPWTLITSADAAPAVPSAGCFAAVAAPAGSGRDTADTGCVTPEPSVRQPPARFMESGLVCAVVYEGAAVVAAAWISGPVWPLVADPW